MDRPMSDAMRLEILADLSGGYEDLDLEQPMADLGRRAEAAAATRPTPAPTSRDQRRRYAALSRRAQTR